MHLPARDIGKLQDLRHQIKLANDVVDVAHHEKKVVLPHSVQQGVNGYTIILIQALGGNVFLLNKTKGTRFRVPRLSLLSRGRSPTCIRDCGELVSHILKSVCPK